MSGLAEWAIGLGRPLGVGLLLLASGLALAGYLLLWALWQLHIFQYMKNRRARKLKNGTD